MFDVLYVGRRKLEGILLLGDDWQAVMAASGGWLIVERVNSQVVNSGLADILVGSLWMAKYDGSAMEAGIYRRMNKETIALSGIYKEMGTIVHCANPLYRMLKEKKYWRASCRSKGGGAKEEKECSYKQMLVIARGTRVLDSMARFLKSSFIGTSRSLGSKTSSKYCRNVRNGRMSGMLIGIHIMLREAVTLSRVVGPRPILDRNAVKVSRKTKKQMK